MPTPVYKSSYAASHALVIGIDAYQHASPLGSAVADATAVAALLISRFQFPGANVSMLLDTAATKAAILNAFFAYASDRCDVNDRIVIFFAGHGHTHQSLRGDVGFLVPHDGDPSNVGSLIGWQDLTRAADFFDAKHMVFFMDACYGGLAVTRSLAPGSMRYLNDMLLRPARQVLTAGKANETVGDLGGPLSGHSPFTGHLLEALEGKAEYLKGVITANSVMAYVYQAVALDGQSRQTPHYGYLYGDGDFIFAAPILSAAAQTEAAASKADEDILVAVPVTSPAGASTMAPTESIARTKEYLSDDRHRIHLHDMIMEEIRRVVQLTSEDHFNVQKPWSDDEFRQRIESYNRTLDELCATEALLGHWATEPTRPLVGLALQRLADRLAAPSELNWWTALRWYPILLLLYSGGIAAVAAQRYDNLRALLGTRVLTPRREGVPAVQAAIDALSDIGGDVFRRMPGHEEQYTARSEYLHKLLQPMFDDLFFMGSDYDAAFDRFEILFALEYMHRAGSSWAPVGRFGWKLKRGMTSPLTEVLAEATQDGDAWPPLRGGLFNGSRVRLDQVSGQLREFVAKLGWW